MQSYDIGFICDYKFGRNEQIIPIKILEYMAAGLPVIGSNLPKIKSIIQECGNGFIVDLDEENDSIRAILRQVLNRPQMLKELGINSLNGVKDYSWWKMKSKLLDFYGDILSNGYVRLDDSLQ
ncbi:MAG: glycosyltransferase, partial [Smithella sp.]